MTRAAGPRRYLAENGGTPMKRIVLIFGLLSGAVLAGMIAVMMPLVMRGRISFDNAEVIGYSSMLVSFIFVFVGIRQYRETVGGGSVTFGRAFKVGILITLITSLVYVLTWQVVYYGFIPDFFDKYAAFTIEKMAAEGESAAAIATTRKEMAKFKELYQNPLFNMGVTFLEVFPLGLVMTLISAAILRRKPAPGFTPSTATVA
jgi:hypothetical protein